jgi:hypothetical protein
MATIKQLVGTERAEEIYALKDAIKRERILDRDPMAMNRTQFEAYMAARAEAIILDQTSEGTEVNQAFHNAKLYLELLDVKWRQEAKRLSEAHNGS